MIIIILQYNTIYFFIIEFISQVSVSLLLIFGISFIACVFRKFSIRACTALKFRKFSLIFLHI